MIIIGSRVLAIVFLVGGAVVTLLHHRIRYLLVLALAGAVAAGVAYLLDRIAPSRRPASSTSTTRSVGWPAQGSEWTRPRRDRGDRHRFGTVVDPPLATTRLGPRARVDVRPARHRTGVVRHGARCSSGGSSAPRRRVARGSVAVRPVTRSPTGSPASVYRSPAWKSRASTRGSTPYRGGGRGRQVVREGVGRRPAQRRHPLPHLPLRDASQSGRRAPVLLVASHRRARGFRRAHRGRHRRPHATLVAMATAEPSAFVLAYEAIEGRSLDHSPSATSTPTDSRSWTASTRLPSDSSLASHTAIFGSRTSSSPTTASPGRSTSASVNARRRTCCWPTTSPS